MKKILLALLLILTASTSYATDYYSGTAGGNIADNNKWYIQSEVTGTCAATGTPVASATVLQAGNSVFANGCTGIAITASFTADKISTIDGDGAGAAVAGGTFTTVTSVTPITITAYTEPGTTDCLAVSGSANANPALTIVGSGTGSATTANRRAVSDTHTVGTVIINGNFSGGAASNAYGYFYDSATANGTIITGNCTGTASSGCVNNGTYPGSFTVNGDCVGSSTANISGCGGLTAGGINVVGKLKAGERGQGVSGAIFYNPTGSDYIQMNGSSTRYLGLAPAVTDVRLGVTYGYDGANPYSGTLVGGGGWGW